MEILRHRQPLRVDNVGMGKISVPAIATPTQWASAELVKGTCATPGQSVDEIWGVDASQSHKLEFNNVAPGNYAVFKTFVNQHGFEQVVCENVHIPEPPAPKKFCQIIDWIGSYKIDTPPATTVYRPSYALSHRLPCATVDW